MKIFRFLGWFLLAALFATPIALSLLTLQAQAAEGTIVDLSPTVGLVREYLVIGIDALIAAAIGWALRFLHLSGSAKAAELADQARAFLHGAIENGINQALAKYGPSMSSIDVGDQVFASVLAYVQTNAAPALDRLNASPDELRNRIEAQLGARGQVLPFVRASP